ncbi:hypothetical protein Cgig2_032779 [Carnegiea gigantea]|uniref:Uncharacterized protein n=1 Tax=Carnegiea gigantea TaxID=171969 RepID=A0A9Q1GYB2_9CARY|nr:hypothetical protein Cgig2_032779 [Carnegiea gigantea]
MVFPDFLSTEQAPDYVRATFRWHLRQISRPSRSFPENYCSLCPYFDLDMVEESTRDFRIPNMTQAVFYAIVLNNTVELGVTSRDVADALTYPGQAEHPLPQPKGHGFPEEASTKREVSLARGNKSGRCCHPLRLGKPPQSRSSPRTSVQGIAAAAAPTPLRTRPPPSKGKGTERLTQHRRSGGRSPLTRPKGSLLPRGLGVANRPLREP